MTAVFNYEPDKYIEKVNRRVKTELHVRMVTCYYNNLKKKNYKKKTTQKTKQKKKTNPLVNTNLIKDKFTSLTVL